RREVSPMRRQAWCSTLMIGLLVLGSLLAPAPSLAGLNSWTTGGPANLSPVDAANSLAIDPQTPTTLYATSFGIDSDVAGGVFKSTDGGATWSSINNGLPSNLAMAIVVDPVTPSTVYVTMAPHVGVLGGVFKSTNGGANWTRMSNGLPSGPSAVGEAPNLYRALAIDPGNPSTLYAGGAISGGSVPGPALVYRTQNGGSTWTLVNTGLETATSVLAIAVLNSSVYVGTSTGGVYKSTNQGASWQPINMGLTDMFVFSVATTNFSPPSEN